MGRAAPIREVRGETYEKDGWRGHCTGRVKGMCTGGGSGRLHRQG